jgi:hypothetical protein
MNTLSCFASSLPCFAWNVVLDQTCAFFQVGDSPRSLLLWPLCGIDTGAYAWVSDGRVSHSIELPGRCFGYAISENSRHDEDRFRCGILKQSMGHLASSFPLCFKGVWLYLRASAQICGELLPFSVSFAFLTGMKKFLNLNCKEGETIRHFTAL